MKASTLLTMQHHGILELCDAVAFGTVSMRETLLPQLAGDLKAHVRVEEELLYPIAEVALADDVDYAAEAESATSYAQHALAKRFLQRLLDTPVSDARFEARALELRSVIAEHAREEENEILPRLERRLSPADNRALATRMMMLHHASLDAAFDMPMLAKTSPELTPVAIAALSTSR